MKQEIDPKVFVVIVALAVVILGGAACWVWMAPSAHAAPTEAANLHAGGVRAQFEAMRAEHMGKGQGQAGVPQNTAR